MSASLTSYLGLKTCRYLLKISYIGTRYKGVQRLSRRIDDSKYDEEDGSIQCALENAIDRALCPVYGSRMAISSRTDAGVHAYQNFLNVDLTHPFANTVYKPSFITENVNRILAMNSHEITVLESRMVPSYFHSRINAKYRSYVYRFAISSRKTTNCESSLTRKEKYYSLLASLPVSQVNRCHIVSSLNLDLVMQCIDKLKGEHDFASFSTKDKKATDKCTVKNIEQLELRQCPHPLTSFELENESYSHLQFYELYIKSTSFLYNQCRRMASAIIDVGSGRLTLEDIEKMLDTPYYRCPRMSPMVPAYGLYLAEVGYDENDFVLNDSIDSVVEPSPKANYQADTFGL